MWHMFTIWWFATSLSLSGRGSFLIYGSQHPPCGCLYSTNVCTLTLLSCEIHMFFFFFPKYPPTTTHTHTHKDTRISDNTGGTIWLVLFVFFERSIPFRNAANTLKCNTVPSREAVYENYSWIPRWVLWIITTSRQHNFTVGQRIAVLKWVECF